MDDAPYRKRCLVELAISSMQFTNEVGEIHWKAYPSIVWKGTSNMGSQSTLWEQGWCGRTGRSMLYATDEREEMFETLSTYGMDECGWSQRIM